MGPAAIEDPRRLERTEHLFAIRSAAGLRGRPIRIRRIRQVVDDLEDVTGGRHVLTLCPAIAEADGRVEELEVRRVVSHARNRRRSASCRAHWNRPRRAANQGSTPSYVTVQSLRQVRPRLRADRTQPNWLVLRRVRHDRPGTGDRAARQDGCQKRPRVRILRFGQLGAEQLRQ